MSELGNRLKEARIAKGLSLEELQDLTKIQVRYLVGIEEGNYRILPGQFYTRAFIKQYAEAVGLSSEDLFEEFKSEIPDSVNKELLPENLSRVHSRGTVSTKSSKIFDVLPTVLFVLLIIGVLFLFWYFIIYKDSGNQPDTTPKTTDESLYEQSDKLTNQAEEEDTSSDSEGEDVPSNDAEQEEEQEETPKQEVTEVKQEGNTIFYELKNADSFVIKLVSTGKTWVDMRNGKNYSFFSGILEQGQTVEHEHDFSNEEEAYLVLGNSNETEVYINGEKLEFEVSPSVRRDITIKYVKNEE